MVLGERVKEAKRVAVTKLVLIDQGLIFKVCQRHLLQIIQNLDNYAFTLGLMESVLDKVLR